MEEYDENECCVIKSEASRVRAVYLDSDRPEKRLGVTKDGIATVDLVRSLNGEQHFFTDHLQLDSFKRDPEIAAAVKTLRLELEQNTPQQGITMGGLS